MAELWDAEWAIDTDIARAVIGAQFPEHTSAAIEPLSWGFDNAAFTVDGDWLFRFPRRKVAVPLIEREIRLLPALAPTLPVRIPVPELIGRPSERFAHPFLGYRMLPGNTACRVQLTAEEHAALAAPLAEFLRALHAFPVERGSSLGVEPDPLGRMDVPMRQKKSRGLLAELHGVGLVSSEELPRFEAILDETPAVAPHRPVLVHGDLYSRHLLVDERRALTGIIDWGDVHIGHRASDLEIAHAFLPASARGRFRDIYGEIDDTTWELARFRALGHTLFVLRFAHTIGDAALLQEGRWSLSCVLDE